MITWIEQSLALEEWYESNQPYLDHLNFWIIFFVYLPFFYPIMVVCSPFWVLYFLTVGMTLLLNPEGPKLIKSKKFIMIVEDYLMIIYSNWAARSFGWIAFTDLGIKEN